MKKYGLVIFKTTHQAIGAEKVLIKKQIRVRIIPVPEKIKKSCGFAIKYDIEMEETVLNLLSQNRILYESYYHVELINKELIYRKVG